VARHEQVLSNACRRGGFSPPTAARDRRRKLPASVGGTTPFAQTPCAKGIFISSRGRVCPRRVPPPRRDAAT
jgi:hypothetical protein